MCLGRLHEGTVVHFLHFRTVDGRNHEEVYQHRDQQDDRVVVDHGLFGFIYFIH